MRQSDFINHLIKWVEEYRADIRPLRNRADAGKEPYDKYDEAYDIHLEELHALVEGFLEDEGLVPERTMTP